MLPAHRACTAGMPHSLFENFKTHRLLANSKLWEAQQ